MVISAKGKKPTPKPKPKPKPKPPIKRPIREKRELPGEGGHPKNR